MWQSPKHWPHSNWTVSKLLLPAKRPSVRLKWCIAIKSLQRPQSPVQRLPLSRMIYWIIRLLKSRSRTRFMPIGWRRSTSQNNHNVALGFRAIFVPFLIKKRHFLQVFVPHILIFKKLHLLLLSKMEVQAENGAKNH